MLKYLWILLLLAVLPQEDNLLTKTYTVGDGTGTSISVSYPEAWFAQGSLGQVSFASFEDGLPFGSAMPSEGEVLGSLAFFTPVVIERMGIQSGLTDLLGTIVERFNETQAFTLDLPENIILVEDHIAYALTRASLGQAWGDAAIVMMEVDGRYGILIYIVADGEVEAQIGLVFDIANSVRLTPPPPSAILSPFDPGVDLPLSISTDGSEGGILSLNYPEDWVTEATGLVISLADNEATLSGQPSGNRWFQTSVTVFFNDQLTLLGLRDDESVVDFVNAFQQVINQNGTIQFDPTETFLSGDRPAASIQGRGIANRIGFDVLIVGVEDESGYIVLVLSGQGVLNGYFQIVRDIAATIDFEPTNGRESSYQETHDGTHLSRSLKAKRHLRSST